jgi:glycerol-3-phosphate acyltransferase PlsY
MNPNLYYLFMLVWCYFLGSIPVGYVLMKWFKDIDIRQHGSGNIGMTNVWRVAGPTWGVSTLALDITKGALAIYLSSLHFERDMDIVVGAVGVLAGNLFPIFLKFKGGKGVGTSIGVFYSIVPFESFVATLAFAVVAYFTRMVSASSMVAVTVFALTVAHYHGITWSGSELAMAACLLVCWSHRSNFLRIINGTESRIGRKSGGSK